MKKALKDALRQSISEVKLDTIYVEAFGTMIFTQKYFSTGFASAKQV